MNFNEIIADLSTSTNIFIETGLSPDDAVTEAISTFIRELDAMISGNDHDEATKAEMKKAIEDARTISKDSDLRLRVINS